MRKHRAQNALRRRSWIKPFLIWSSNEAGVEIRLIHIQNCLDKVTPVSVVALNQETRNICAIRGMKWEEQLHSPFAYEVDRYRCLIISANLWKKVLQCPAQIISDGFISRVWREPRSLLCPVKHMVEYVGIESVFGVENKVTTIVRIPGELW